MNLDQQNDSTRAEFDESAIIAHSVAEFTTANRSHLGARRCYSCDSGDWLQAAELVCGHLWCEWCLKRTYEGALAISMIWPPTCAGGKPECRSAFELNQTIKVVIPEELWETVSEREGAAATSETRSWAGEAPIPPPENDDEGRLGHEGTENAAELENHQCSLCLEDLDAEVGRSVELTCGHYWCSDCLNSSLRWAASSLANWPPRCCGPEIIDEARPDTLRLALSEETLTMMYEKKEELGSDNPTYCPKPDCGIFISEENGNPRARFTCCPKPKCMTTVCKVCKCERREHTLDARKQHLTCPDPLGAENRKLIAEGKMQQCPQQGCWTVVEKTEGCDHMTCPICSLDFCYICSKELSTPLYQCPCGGGAPRLEELEDEEEEDDEEDEEKEEEEQQPEEEEQENEV